MRVHNALQAGSSAVTSEFWCASRGTPQTHCFRKGWLAKGMDRIKNLVLIKLLKRPVRSLNVFPSSLISGLNASDADVVHFHWVNGEIASVEQIGTLKKPLVWTMHDMWPFCGAEHYTTLSRYVDGYTKETFGLTRLEEKEGKKGLLTYLDIDRWVFRRKQRAWKELNLHVISPSRWLARCAKDSVLFREVPVMVIPNCVDLNVFRPLGEKAVLLAKYGISIHKKVLLFGAVSPDVMRKGGDLLIDVLTGLSNPDDYVMVVFGKTSGENFPGMEMRYVGNVSSETQMAELYCCADVMCVPSRQDNLPNTCVEAHACGLPVVAFDVGGIADIIEHRQTGYLAKPFDVEEFRSGIEWVTSLGKRTDRHDEALTYNDICTKARTKAERAFAPDVIADKYSSLYGEVIERI